MTSRYILFSISGYKTCITSYEYRNLLRILWESFQASRYVTSRYRQAHLQIYIRVSYITIITKIQTNNKDLAQGVVSDIWGEKFWLCYLPIDPNLEKYNATSDFNNRLAKCGPQMEGGLIIKQYTGQSLCLPSGILHAVCIKKGGFVANSTYSIVKGLRAMARVIDKRLTAIDKILLTLSFSNIYYILVPTESKYA